MKKGVISVVSMLFGAAVGAGAVGKNVGEKKKMFQELSDKHLSLFIMMKRWVEVKQEGKNLSEYLVRSGYKNIAIYGMSYAGETLVNELNDTEINVKYGIDRKADSIRADIDVVSMDDDLEEVDAIVVTAITFFDEIAEKLEEKVNCPIISLEDMLYEV